MLARSAVGGAFVRGVTATAHAAFEENNTLAHLGEVGEHLFLVFGQNLRAHGHLDHQIVRARAGAVLALPVIAALRLEVLRIAEVDQCVEAGDRFENDVTATAAIAAVGTTIFDILLAPE